MYKEKVHGLLQVLPATFYRMHVMTKNNTVETPQKILLASFSIIVNFRLQFVVFQCIKLHGGIQPCIPPVFLSNNVQAIRMSQS